MLKKSFKYLLIAVINLTVLTALLVLWTDKLELTLNDKVRPIEFLKILVFTLLSLIGMRILVTFLRRKNFVSLKPKIIIATLLTFLISSYLYIDYAPKILRNVIINRQLRKEIANKIKPANILANGTMADNLTIIEYREVAGLISSHKLPDEASNIKYVYSYDGFLPDYVFTLSYDVPKEMKVDTFNYQKGDFTQSQAFEIIDNIKRIKYSEGER